MKVLVTGATGYVGRAVTRRLVDEGHVAVALVRNLPRALELMPREGVVLVEGDLHSAHRVVPQDIDAVVHLAFSLFPVSDGRTNLEGSRRIIEAARARNVRRFVFTSSALVYGPSDPTQAVAEDHPCRPDMRFARQQLEVEHALRSLAAVDGFPAVILRPSEIYGGDGGFLPVMIERLRCGQLPVAGDGRQGISFTAREDLAETITRCLTAELPAGDVLNINAPVLVETATLFDRLARRLGGPRPRRIPVPMVYCFGAIAGTLARARGLTPSFNLDLARLSCMRSGPRCIDKAHARLGFRPTDEDPLAAIERLHAGANHASGRTGLAP